MLRRVLRRFSSYDYDLAVIGAGPGGYVAAIKAAQLGMKTVCVEGRQTLGGTCLNVGCIPSKSLLNSSHKWHDLTHEMKQHGILADNPRIDFAQMMKMKDKAVVGLTKGIEQLFKKNKVDHVFGWGGLQDDHTISVREQDKIARTLSAKNVILATGSIPSPMPGGALTLDRKRILTSTGALDLPEIPKKLVVVGGGVIGLELGSVYCRLGSDVTVVEFLDRVTPTADIETSAAFQKILKKQGIKFQMATKVVGGENKGDYVELQLESKGEKSTLEADYVLVAVGRSPNTQDLNLDAMGISYDKRGFIDVNDDLQIPNKEHIYAIGDCIRGPMLAHKAEEEGIFAAEHIAGTMCHMNYDAIPGVVYTFPEMAYVGQTEEQLKEAGIKYNKGSFPFMANSRARANHDAEGFVKILSDKETDKILGAHIIAANAGEMIMEAVISIEYGASSEDIGRTCHAHPSLSEAFKEACLATYSKPIHF